MCPQKCSPEEMSCWGGKDGNDCTMPDFCIPMKGGPVGNDGMECPVFCPMKCAFDDIQCYSGNDDNGCPMPDYCMPGSFDIECPPPKN